MITDKAIQNVMDTTGMERVQAWHHLQQRETLQRRDIESRRAAADAAVASHIADTEPCHFRPIGELIREITADFLIVEDADAFDRSMSATLELKPGGVCRVEGLRKWDWIDRLTPAAAAKALSDPISESRKVCPFPISRADLARLKVRATS